MKRNEDDEHETALYGSGEQTEPTPPLPRDGDVKFDYAAFEQSLDPQPPLPEPPPRPSADTVQQRKTVDLQALPKDDAVYDVRQLGRYQVVTIRGQINESFQVCSPPVRSTCSPS
ncbi:MAG: hypothetical protein R3F59_12835 [Myxococcota bacterium]